MIVFYLNDFPEHVQISKKRRAVYWKGSAKNLPKKQHGLPVDKKGYVLDKGGNKVIKNSKIAGTPRLWKIGGQDLINGSMHPSMRSKIFMEMKTWISNEIAKQLTAETALSKTPVKQHLTILYPTSWQSNWDLDNYSAVLNKWILDSLVLTGVLSDDNISFVDKIIVEAFRNIEDKIDLRIEITS